MKRTCLSLDLGIGWLSTPFDSVVLSSEVYTTYTKHDLKILNKILRLNTILSVKKIFPPPHPFLPWLLWISLLSTK